jgi:enoyl-CoA hydratase
MDYRFILYDKFDDIAKITINRPEVRNALSRQVYEEMDDAFTEAEKDAEVRVIILAGAGATFCAGHDIGSKEMLEDEKLRPRGSSPLAQLTYLSDYIFAKPDRWRNINKPTIAMVQGHCIMGGWEIASACDLIVAADDAKFADRTVRWGFAPHVEYSSFAWDLGPRKAKEYLWTGDWIDAGEAELLGMINKVVPREKLEEETVKLAKRIALNEPLALRLSKTSINQAADIMGQSAVMKASFHMVALGSAYRRQDSAQRIQGVEWSKEKNKQFD